jgi:hypothetical protein
MSLIQFGTLMYTTSDHHCSFVGINGIVVHRWQFSSFMAPGPGFNPVSFFGGVRVAHRFSFLCCVIFVFVLCAQCCQCLWIALSWLPLLFSLTFINPDTYYRSVLPSQKIEPSCICVLEVSILSLSTIFILGFGTVLTVRYLFSSVY